MRSSKITTANKSTLLPMSPRLCGLAKSRQSNTSRSQGSITTSRLLFYVERVMTMYFIHNRYDAESVQILATIDTDVTVIDFYADPRFRRLKGIKELPCYLERLEFDNDEITRLIHQTESLSAELANAKQELTQVKAQQQAQESILIECFTDLDASINGGGGDATMA